MIKTILIALTCLGLGFIGGRLTAPKGDFSGMVRYSDVSQMVVHIERKAKLLALNKINFREFRKDLRRYSGELKGIK